MYCLAVKKIFPKVEDIEVEFLFLKFNLDKDLLGNKGDGVITMEKICDSELEGFEYQLTSIQEYLDNFSKEDACSNFAANQNYPSDKTFGGPLMCGKEGFKKSRGELVLDKSGNKIPNFICEHRLPFEYFAIVNEDGEVIKTSKKESDLNPEKNQFIEKKQYSGCPHFFSQESVFLV